MKPHGPWKIKKTDDVYQDAFIHVWLDQVVRPDGKDGQHVVVTMKPGVCVLAIDDNNNVHLTSEFHYGVGRVSLEAVSGGIEPGEDPDLTARRELQEELGLEAANWEYLTTVDPFTTIVVSPTRLYIATGLKEVERDLEGTEQIERVTLSLDEAIARIASGEITHAPTCVGLLMAAAKLKQPATNDN
ncbi:MAG: NUDIX hydrolase [Planctomycetota bacterium]